MKFAFVCESGHSMVREKGDYRMCDECGDIVYCWHELLETEPDNMMIPIEIGRG